MPGSYAHITSVYLASNKWRLRSIEGFPPEAIFAANLHSNFLVLGSISPDYPYLHISSTDSKAWADKMHYTHTCKAISKGAEILRGYPEGIPKDKCLAWLMGYVAHVIGDMCVHPVVELKVGPYEENKSDHRMCEMHQDVFIFPRVGATTPDAGSHPRATIGKCGAQNDPEVLDPDVKHLWTEILKSVHPELFADEPPEIDTWHEKCSSILGKLLPTTSHLVGFSRHVCDGLKIRYPLSWEVDKNEFIEDLLVPNPGGVETRMHYDQIFDKAISHIQRAWLDVTRYIYGRGDLVEIRDGEWNLDTGKNESARDETYVYWGYA